MIHQRDTWWLVERRGCQLWATGRGSFHGLTNDATRAERFASKFDAEEEIRCAEDHFRDELVATEHKSIRFDDPEGTNAQLLANALSRAEKAEDDLRAEILHSAKMRKERDNARAECTWLAKLLIRLREALNNIAEGAEDEGDRVYFGSTNDADWLKEIACEVDSYAFDRIMRESKWLDYIESSAKANARATAAEAEVERLRKALEPFANAAKRIDYFDGLNFNARLWAWDYGIAMRELLNGIDGEPITVQQLRAARTAWEGKSDE